MFTFSLWGIDIDIALTLSPDVTGSLEGFLSLGGETASVCVQAFLFNNVLHCKLQHTVMFRQMLF